MTATVTNEIRAHAADLCAQLTLEERLDLLTGRDGFWAGLIKLMTEGAHEPFATGSVPRLGVDGLHTGDGPRGVGFGPATCFPVAMARAATFDPALEERVGEAIGREARAVGITLLTAPCVEVLRHPGWGRAQETYGEDPAHNGEMGAAFVRGAQRHVMACVKHLVANSIENARFRVDVRIEDDVLDSVYLAPYERVVREGVAAVMTAYNRVGGEWCGQHRALLTEILKERWGFDGFVVSDFAFSIHDGVAALNAGLDVELPDAIHFGRRLLGPLTRGEISRERVDDAVQRLLGQQLRFADVLSITSPGGVLACREHRALAREVATRAIVLLRNAPAPDAPVLPLQTDDARRVAVLGPLADVANTGDRGSSNVHAPYVVTPLEGLRAALEPLGVEVIHEPAADPRLAARAAAAADVALVIAGYTAADEGEGFGGEFPPLEVRSLLPAVRPDQEAALAAALGKLAADTSPVGRGGDRRSLTLNSDDEALILAVAAANPRTIVALEAGSAVIIERWRRHVPAILMLWYPGMEGGHALADIVLGRARPTGRLPFAIPTDAAHLPPFDPDADTVEYGPLHGQRLLDHLGVPAAFPFGHGLGYD